jgi:hypothetical protein
MSSQLLFTGVFSIGAASGVAFIYGINNWRSSGGKITTIIAGLLLVAIVAVLALVALLALILPPMIALP